MRARNLRPWALLPGFIVLLAVLALVHGSTTANSIPPSRAGISFHPATAQQLAPPECAGMALTSVAWRDNGTLDGTNASDLLIGSDKTNRINGRNGRDCLVIGSGDKNRLDGGAGNDVCIGNPTTRFNNCEVEIIRGGASAGFAQMDLTPTPEPAGTERLIGPETPTEGLTESPESPAGEGVGSGEETRPEAETTPAAAGTSADAE